MDNLKSLYGDLAESMPPAAPQEKLTIPAPSPGVYYDIPNHTYHSWDAISSTLLKKYAALPSTAMEPYIPGDDANVGSGIHAYSLQGIIGLHSECIISTHRGTSRAAVEARELLVTRNPGKVILPESYGSPAPGQPIMDVLNGVDMSLKAHPKVGPVLTNSLKEVSLVWIDTQSGCKCKARLDMLDGRIVWDLKKTRDIDRFRWQIKELSYEIQAGHYVNGAITNGLPVVAFGFIPCEAFPPYRVDCGYIDPDRLETAQAHAVRLIGLVNQSRDTGIWPNYRIPEYIFDLHDIEPDDLVQVY